jgi:hypothetical protein
MSGDKDDIDFGEGMLPVCVYHKKRDIKIRTIRAQYESLIAKVNAAVVLSALGFCCSLLLVVLHFWPHAAAGLSFIP